MKKLLAFLCCAAMVISMIVIPVAAASPEGGVSFTSNDLYWVENRFEACPTTIEAWLYLPTTHTDRGGAVFSNYASLTSVMGLEIHQNGVPRLYVRAEDRETTYDYKFSNSDVRANGWTHLAIVYDEPNRTLSCYINGVLTETKTVTAAIDVDAYAPLFRIGGDQRINNEQYFKGKIKSVTVYSDVRSVSEITADMAAVNTGDAALMAHYNLDDVVNGVISDNKTGKYNVGKGQHWFTDKEPVTDYAYSFCFVGDPQKIVQQEPGKLHYIYDWILANKDSKKIEYVFGLGDITHTDTAAEWELSKAQIERMNGVIPYSVIRGNHDGSAMLNEYLGTDAYVSQFEGFYSPDKIENSWRTLRAGEQDYLLITLDFGPSDDVLNWASRVIASHPEHKVVITTHAYLYRDGTTLDADDVSPPNATGLNHGETNNGDQMWDKLFSKYENIMLVVSGHDIAAEVIRSQAVGDHGNIVTQLMINPQWADAAENAGATGMVSMLYFSEDGKTITVETYSTVKEKFHLSNNQFVIDTEAVVEEEKKNFPPTTLPNGQQYLSTALYGEEYSWRYALDDKWKTFTKFTPNESTGLMFTIDTSASAAGTDLSAMYILLNSNISVNSTDKTTGWDVHYLSLTPKPAGVSDKTSTWYISENGESWKAIACSYADGSPMKVSNKRGIVYVYVPLSSGFFCTTNTNVIGSGSADGDGDGVESNSYLDILSKTNGTLELDNMRISTKDGVNDRGMRISDFRIVNAFDGETNMQMSVTLTDSFAVNFYADVPHGAQKLEMRVDGTVIVPREDCGKGRTRYTVSDILPQDMSTAVSYCLTYTEAGAATPTLLKGEISIYEYAKKLMASDVDTVWKELAQAMINYGAAAQEYVGMEGGIAVEDVTPSRTDLSTLSGLKGNENSSDKIQSAILRLESTLTLKIKTTSSKLTAKVGARNAVVTMDRDGNAYISLYPYELARTIVLTDDASATCLMTINWYLFSIASDENRTLAGAIADYGIAAAAAISA